MRTRRLSAFFARLLFPAYSWCFECGMPWKFARPHDVQYKSGSGVFFTCEFCWPRLSTRQRLVYARRLASEWSEPDEDKRMAIELAVIRQSAEAAR